MLVDEVLSVGDAEFQARCLGRMEDINTTGRTVVFVSHQVQAVAQLCDRVLLIDEGRIVRDGPSAEVVAQLPPVRDRDELQPDVDGRGGARGRSRPPALGRVTVRRTARPRTSRTCASRSGSRWPSASCGDGPPILPKIKVVAGGQIAFNAMDVGPRSHEPARPGDYVDDGLDPRELPERGSRHSRRRRLLDRLAEAPPPRVDPRGGLVPRPGPARGRLLARDVHRPVARRRPAAARLDDRGGLSAGRRASSSSATRTSSSSRRSGTSRRSAIASTPSTISRPTGRRRSSAASRASSTTSRSGARATRATRIACSRRYAGTPTWALGVDGDELYDPAALARLRAELDAGAHADVFRLKGHVLNCDELDEAQGVAKGYLAPPSRPVTKLFNMAAVDSWTGCLERLHDGAAAFRSGFGWDSLRYLSEGTDWDSDPLRMLHTASSGVRARIRRTARSSAGPPRDGRVSARPARAPAQAAPPALHRPAHQGVPALGLGVEAGVVRTRTGRHRRRAPFFSPVGRSGAVSRVPRVVAEIPFPPLELTAYVGGPHADGARYEEIGRLRRAEILSRLPDDWSFDGKCVLDFGCGAGSTLRHFLDEAERAPSTAATSTLEHRVARREPEPAVPRLRQREVPPLPLETDVARPDLGDLGLHAHLRSLGRLAPRAAPAATGGRLALRDDFRPRPLEEWAKAARDGRGRASQSQRAEAASG